ncbi:MAG: ABC transporter ATP-binding protein [Phycisphaeraceae bacterium]
MLELKSVHFGYEDGEPVVRDVSAVLGPGRLCALLGPNAAGKSTLLKLMLGQLDPVKGSITLDGKPVAALPAQERARRASYVPQRPRTHVAFSVNEVVTMGRFALPVDEGAVEEALRLCDLTSLRSRVFAELSVGQQQRVALARAIAQSLPTGRVPAGVMLLDEPVSAMDLKHVHDTMALLQKLAAKGAAVLAVLHDLNLAAMYGNEIWLMHEGRLAAKGAAKDVLRPEVLEPVYGVSLMTTAIGDAEQPLLFVDRSRRL